ncbi:MAG: MgtC/SapB family protein [Acidobacteriota bacterium]|jgi:uncharacterized membrane protein (DUF4010 family)
MDLETARVLGLALAIGVLVGAERYRVREPGRQEPAGVRTFAAIGLLGGVCAVLGHSAFATATFAAIALIVVIAYYRQSDKSLGATTEMAALLTFWLGYLVKEHEAAALGCGIVLAILLAAKRPMHDFVKGRISDIEFWDTLKFLAVVFVVYPLLPDHALGPWGFFNPRQAWTFVVIYSALSYAGYFLVRVFGSGHGLFASAVMGGLVSTPAVTMSLANRARNSPDHSRLIAAATVMANTMQFPRLLFLVFIVDGDLVEQLAPMLLSMFAVGALGAWAVRSVGRDDGEDGELELVLRNPFSVTAALIFAALLVTFLFFSHFGLAYLGKRGVYAVASLTGLVNVSAIALTLPTLARVGNLSAGHVGMVLFLAIGANALAKWVLTLLNGTREMALWLGAGFLAMLATGLGYLAIRLL